MEILFLVFFFFFNFLLIYIISRASYGFAINTNYIERPYDIFKGPRVENVRWSIINSTIMLTGCASLLV